MIIGKNKDKVISNIKKATEDGNMNIKVEVDDPNLSSEEKKALVNKYLKERGTLGYKLKNAVARFIINFITEKENKNTEIIGIENIKSISGGAIITSNHFNPLDNTAIRHLVKKCKKKKLFIVSRDENMAMQGFVGFFMNYSDIVPISNSTNYMANDFFKIIKDIMAKKQFLLIYPEEEMWFNYRKIRPLKRGAYHYAAKCGVPVVSCFVEIQNLKEKENEEFFKTKYVVHVLTPIFPDPNLSIYDNSIAMMTKDYEQKKEAYEKAYGKKLEYKFTPDDIAGWIPKEV